MSAVQRVLMVCTANICRSPTAEVILRHRVHRAGLHGRIVVDSAGTRTSRDAAHPPDPRSIAHAARRGYDLAGLRSRPVVEDDFRRFDLIVPMDRTHLEHLQAQAPADATARIRLLMSFAPSGSGLIVPDPYYGSAPGFEHVLDLVELACDGLLEYLYSPQGAR
ncbi:low molecular weight protein-tyrosine-phosphatase [Sphaerotilus sp.]|uniref:low molecular weight protein-tyrosine-phosphatase n=1 Tax=Sphaerotilus sp. TaxID=2093942 RepID=UPI002ACDC7B3|nr:low molecular weight protein-tyrosine-phosphatase [Sphaerotilus sp.]MDZ7857660.1 low molecular weight protein-tyrosine-phosphatase [Sphaerotilus sp.]